MNASCSVPLNERNNFRKWLIVRIYVLTAYKLSSYFHQRENASKKVILLAIGVSRLRERDERQTLITDFN